MVVKFTVSRCGIFNKLSLTVHLDIIYLCHLVICVLDLHFTLKWLWLGRNCKVQFTVCYIHQTFTNCSSWHDLLTSHVGLYSWPTFHAWVSEWVTMVREEFHFTVPRYATFTKLTPTIYLDIIYWCHLLVHVLDLHFTVVWPLLGRNGYINITVPMCATFTQLTPTVHLDIITNVMWCFVSLTYISRLSDHW